MSKEPIMRLYCAGPRGSLASPSCKATGFDTSEYGGNTTCYYIEAGPFKIIIDMGTGAGPLGRKLAGELQMFSPHYVGHHFITCLTHYHWDHTGGLPFFVPCFLSQNVLHFHGFTPREGKADYMQSEVKRLLSTSQATPQFPLPYRELPAQTEHNDHSPMQSEEIYYESYGPNLVKRLPFQGHMEDETKFLKITTIPLHHPDGCLGYKFNYMGKTITFCTDIEPQRFPNANINRIAKGTDLIVLDGQYRDEQLGGMTQGFGHGSPESCLEQAKACDAKRLVITHHDPANDDKALAKMESELSPDKIDWCFAKEGHYYSV